MRRHVSAVLRAGLLAAVPLAAVAHEPGPHQHGVARLQVAVDGSVLSLFLDSPLDNLLGFEHYPKTGQQKAAVRTLGERLRKAQAVFVTTPEARCTATSVSLKSPVFEPTPPASAGAHADLEAEFVFRCEVPERLRSVEVRLFRGFPNMQRIEAQLAGPKGQVAATLDSSNRALRW
ncbi:MAG TPA: DUF2796 domain-containing protein [Burkholderiales bacterium]|nr:DUF2796 domain-containing protein [Burkholderiales bacterium]